MSDVQRCGFNGCDKGGRVARGLCMGHYKQWQLGKDLTPLKPWRIEKQPPCAFDGCDLPQRTKGWCKPHYMQQWAGKPLKPLGQSRARRECAYRGCRLTEHAKGLCHAHYTQMRLGQDLRPMRTWEYKPWHDQHGYLIETVPVDQPNARVRKGRNTAQIFQHIRVMTETLGRPLLPGETVHHKNGVKDDNRPTNLELWVRSQPTGQRARDLLSWAEEIVARYRPERDKL